MNGLATTVFTTHFVVDVCDIHAIEHVVFEVVPQYPSQDIEGDVRPVQIVGKDKNCQHLNDKLPLWDL